MLESDLGHIIQLTNFHRVDTAGGFLSNDKQRVFFVASADLGDNPSETCQIFSVDVLGTDVRQLTHFGTAAHSDTGCAIIPPGPACFTMTPVQDDRTGAVVFYSTCDPVGENPNGGGQVFTMAPDGTALRQLTHTHGAVTEDDGSVDVELPGPIFYSVQDGAVG